MSIKDSKRFQRPGKTIPITSFQEAQESTFLDNQERLDGRSPSEMCKMFIALDVISQAKGSSFIEIGNTKVVCGVYGPRELQRGTDFKLTGQVACELKYAPFSSTVRKLPQPDRSQKEKSQQLKEALETVIILEKYPKTEIDVYITVLEDGGSLLSTCLIAACLALCHASIDVYDLVVAADVVWHEGVCYVNPTLHEEQYLSNERLKGRHGSGCLSLGMMPKFAKGQVSLMVHEGESPVDTLVEAITLATETCQKIYNLARQTLVKHVDRVLKNEKA